MNRIEETEQRPAGIDCGHDIATGDLLATLQSHAGNLSAGERLGEVRDYEFDPDTLGFEATKAPDDER